MNIRDITLTEFCSETSTAKEYSVDVNSLLGVCGASPINMQYKTDNIIAFTTYPEMILLMSGKTHMRISQIRNIQKLLKDDGKVVYKILCGTLDELQTVVMITQI